MTPIVPVRSPSWNVETTTLNGRSSGEVCSDPMTTARPRASMRPREQFHELVLLFDHAEEHPRRLERALLVGGVARQSVDEKRRALHVQRFVRAALRPRPLCARSAPGHQRVVEHPLLAHALDDRGARFVERQARKSAW